jgi:ATP-binding cassette subfamily B protein
MLQSLTRYIPPAPRSVDFDLKQTLIRNRFRSLWQLMTGYRKLYLVAALSAGMAALANTGIFLLLRYFIDNWLGASTPATSLWIIVAGFMGLASLQALFTFNARRLAAQAAEGISLRTRNYLYDHIQRLPFRYHDQAQTGDLLQRATSDVDTIRRFFADQAIESGRIVLMFVVTFAAIAVLNVTLAWISIVILPFVMVVSLIFFKRIEKTYKAFQEQEAVVSSRLQENLTGVRVVKAFARQEFEKGKFDEVNFEKYRRGRILLIMHALYWPITDLMCGAQLLLGYGVAANMAIAGVITVGTFTAYSGLVQWLIWPLRNLGRLVVQMSESFVSLVRIGEVIREEREPISEGEVLLPETRVTEPYTNGHKPHTVPATAMASSAHPVAVDGAGHDVDAGRPAMRGHLRFESVSFTYPGSDKQVLHDISFEATPGESIALLGTTGSGKTSLVNLLPRFYDYTEGSIKLDGQELRTLPADYLRRHIGIVEQEPFLFSMSVRDNISYGVGRAVTDEEVEEAARAAAIHDVILSKLPEGYKTLVGERGITLSGGQKQRVAIARTLLKDPRILILDDSTSSVDTETEAEIREALRRLMQGRTTFIIGHRIQSVMDADQIFVLDGGEIIQRGRHEELVAQPGAYRRIFDAQTRIEQELEEELTRVG